MNKLIQWVIFAAMLVITILSAMGIVSASRTIEQVYFNDSLGMDQPSQYEYSILIPFDPAIFNTGSFRYSLNVTTAPSTDQSVQFGFYNGEIFIYYDLYADTLNNDYYVDIFENPTGYTLAGPGTYNLTVDWNTTDYTFYYYIDNDLVATLLIGEIVDLTGYTDIKLYERANGNTTINSVGLYKITDCTPNWVCSEYTACNASDMHVCNSTRDTQNCGEVYTGNYSEFAPHACTSFTDQFNTRPELTFGQTDAYNWTCTGYANCEFNSTYYTNSGSSTYLWQNLSTTKNLFMGDGFQMQTRIYNQPNSNADFSCVGFKSNFDDYTAYPYGADYIVVCPNYDSLDSSTNDDIRVFCGGACSCVDPYVADITEDQFYNMNITYSPKDQKLQIDRDGVSATTYISGCEMPSSVGLFERVTDTGGFDSFFITTGGADACVPNWTCSGYTVCNTSDLRMCNSTTDQNTCGDVYNGDFSEFAPQSCDYCTPSWSCIGYGACAINDTKACNSVNDSNTCYVQTSLASDQYNGTYTEFNSTICDYCTPNWSCSVFNACNSSNIRPCTLVTDNLTCYVFTGLASDQFNGTLSSYNTACVFSTPSGGGGSYSTYIEPLAARASDLTTETTQKTGDWWGGLPPQEQQIYILIGAGFAIAFLLRGKFL